MLAEIFSSKERQRVVDLVLFGNEKQLRVREIARAAGVSPALVSGTLKIFRKQKIVKGKEIDFLGAKTRALKIVLNIEKLESTKVVEEIKRLFPECTGIGIYGSWANGTNCKESNLDIWIKTAGDGKENRLRAFVRGGLDAEISPLLLTKKRLKEMREKDFVFYCMLYNSFVLWGEGI